MAELDRTANLLRQIGQPRTPAEMKYVDELNLRAAAIIDAKKAYHYHQLPDLLSRSGLISQRKLHVFSQQRDAIESRVAALFERFYGVAVAFKSSASASHHWYPSTHAAKAVYFADLVLDGLLLAN